jgi:anti-sigma28 factor (negative regulator of flagellin synthesis)
MHISNQFSVSGVDAVRSTAKAAAPADTQSAASSGSIQEPVDQLELSAEALEVSQTSISGSFRADKVAQMREAIASGKYDTDEMLEKAFDRMLDRYL